MKSIQEKISELKQKKNAVILAHYYQHPEIQDIADFVGDSLALSKQASSTSADIIVFAGVYFMAETAKILNPSKKVLVPDRKASCSLVEGCSKEDFLKFKNQYPDHVAVTYINCSAEIKALSDIVCTSSNAVKVIQSIPAKKSILFAPDKNLGKYLIKETGRSMVLWDGACIVHELFSMDKLIKMCQQYPTARIVAHPESNEHLLKIAHFVGSTSAMLNYVLDSPAKEFLIATEVGIIHQMSAVAKDKKIIPVPTSEENTCSCSECGYMKLNILKKIYSCLQNEYPYITLDTALMSKALLPLERMMSISA